MKIPQFLKRKFDKHRIIKETEAYIINKDIVGKKIECKKCGMQSYDPEHLRLIYCPNCGRKWRN